MASVKTRDCLEDFQAHVCGNGQDVPVRIYRDDGSPFDPSRIFDRLVDIGTGRLTTNHAASSYGQPVLILADGTVLGTGDVPKDWEIALEVPEVLCVEDPDYPDARGAELNPAYPAARAMRSRFLYI